MILRKRGQLGEQIVMFAFMFLLVIVGGGIVLGTGIFIGPEADYRGIEADFLWKKVVNCISRGDINLKDLADKRADLDFFANKCGLNKEVMIEGGNLIKICKGDIGKDCINKNDNDVLFSSGGDFNSCLLGVKDAPDCEPIVSKFSGCYICSFEGNTIITTSKRWLLKSG